MPWDDYIVLAITLGFYSVTLVIYSSTIRRVKFGNFIEIDLSSSDISQYRCLLRVLFTSISIILITISVYININSSRKYFFGLLFFGILLIVVRLATLISRRFSFLGFELELDTNFDPKLFHASRSSFIVGGVALIIIGLLPFTIDAGLWIYFKDQQKLEAQKLVLEVSSHKFLATYHQRHLNTGGLALSENSFIEGLVSGQRFILKGRAGIGKTTFLKKLRSDYYRTHQNDSLVFLEARKLSHKISIHENFNRSTFKMLSWASLPLAQQILKNSLIIIDGIDEVGYEGRGILLSKIQLLARDYPESTIIVTTRPVGFEPLNGFNVMEIESLDESQTDATIQKQRIKLLFEEVAKRQKSAKMDEHFIRLLTVTPLVISEPLTIQKLEELFRCFLKVYKFDVKIGNRYAFLSTFRDIEIIENLFVQSLFGQLPMTVQFREFGRTQLYEHFLKQKIFKNCRLNDGEEHLVQEAIDEITSICNIIYDKSNGNVMTFNISKDMLHNSFNNNIFQHFIVASEIIVEDEKGYKFDNKSIDEYFISRILKSKIDKSINIKSEIIAYNDFYSGSEVLPFLVGHYEQIDQIMPDIINALHKKKKQKALEDYMRHDFKLFFLHIQRREQNYAQLKRLKGHLSPAIEKIFDSQLREYLTAVTGDS